MPAEALTAEATPHHLVLTMDDFIQFGPQGLIMPPLRSAQDVSALWDAVQSGDIATVGSDHAPHHVDEKEQGRSDLRKAPSGLPGTRNVSACRIDGVPSSWSERTNLRASSRQKRPASLFGLSGRKGVIAPGFDADLVIVDDRVDEAIDSTKFLSKAKYSPFHGRRVSARVDLTMVRGQTIYADGGINEDARPGCFLRPQRGRS